MLRHLIPTQIESQLMVVLALSFTILLGILAILETLDQDDVVDWARSDYSSARLARIVPVLPRLQEVEIRGYIDDISRCHEGYTLTDKPHPIDRRNTETDSIETRISQALNTSQEKVAVGFVLLTEEDFSYGDCSIGEIEFPVEGIVISVRTGSNQWLNAEIHPHEWHFTPTMTAWFTRSTVAFFLVGTIAYLFVRRIGRPLNALTTAARAFGKELRVEAVDETGPPDVKRAIQSFNAMQSQVADEVKKRTTTLAAISHDIRSPLTALRLKAELVDNENIRKDLLLSVLKMERVSESALEYLKGDSRNEEKKQVDICSLVESECNDFTEAGESVSFTCTQNISLDCRPDALSRAVRNLVENAVKYAGHADVAVRRTEKGAVISVSDNGLGIPTRLHTAALEPFERLSNARESSLGGFGLGLASTKAIVDGHNGSLTLSENTPSGLVVTLSIPIAD